MTIYTTPKLFEDQTPSAGQRLGKTLVSGISSGIDALLKNKLEGMNQTDDFSQFAKKKPSETSGYQSTPGAETSGYQSTPGAETSGYQDDQDYYDLPTKSDFYTDEEILRASSKSKDAGNALLKFNDINRSKLNRAEDREKPSIDKYFQEINKEASTLINKETSINTMMDSVKTGNLGPLSLDWLADVTGIDGLRTAKGAVFESAKKELLLGSIGRVGPRPNQWIEQQITKMFPKIGQTTDANLSVLAFLKTEDNITRKKGEIANKLRREDLKKYPFPRGTIPERVDKELRPFAEKNYEILENRLKDIQSNHQTLTEKNSTTMTGVDGKKSRVLNERIDEVRKMGLKLDNEVFMNDPDGNLRIVSKKDAADAKKNGYTLER